MLCNMLYIEISGFVLLNILISKCYFSKGVCVTITITVGREVWDNRKNKDVEDLDPCKHH